MKRLSFMGMLFAIACFWVEGSGVQAQTYESLWKQVEQAQEKSLPQTVVKLADEICHKARTEKNSAQLFKAYLYKGFWQERLTPDSLYSRLQDMEQWASMAADGTERAILHSILSQEYASYWQRKRGTIGARTDVMDDITSADMREWSPRQFVEKVVSHSLSATADAKQLSLLSTKDYLPFVELGDQSSYYGHDLYHLLARRAVDALTLMEGAGADSLVQAHIETLYGQMETLYEARPDGADACLLVTLDYWEWKRAKADGREKDEVYLAALDSLMERYADRSLCAEVYWRKAQWMGQERGEGRSLAEAIRLCDEAIRRYPSYRRIGLLKQFRAELLRPQISLSAEGIGYPGDTLSLQVHYRTMEKPVTLNVYATKLKTFDSQYNCDDAKDFRRMSPRRIYTKKHHLLPLPAAEKLQADVPYLPSDTTLTLPIPDEPGVYVVEILPEGKNSRTDRCFLYVSRLRLMTLDLGDGQLEVRAVDGSTGHAVEGTRVSFYSSANGQERKLVKEVVTDSGGKALVNLDEKPVPVYYTVEKGTDTALPPAAIYLNGSYRPEVNHRFGVSLLTDRSIYRPGQTVYIKGVVYRLGTDSAQTVKGEWVELELLDANRKQIATRRVQTNDFGSVTADFVLPSACLNGVFSVRTMGTVKGNIAFRVEEYKRPTFEITFQPVTIPYRLGEKVTVCGEVKAFSGASVQEMPLAYRVVRRDRFRIYGSAGENTLKADTVRLDRQGCFAFDVLLEGGEGEKPRFRQITPDYVYEVEVSVTNEAGETQTATYSLQAGPQAFHLNLSLGTQQCKEDTAAWWQIHASNPQGVSLRLTADWRVDVETETGHLKTKNGEPLLTGRCLTEVRNPSATWKNLPSGRYRLTAWAVDSLGHRVESQTSFVLFSKYDRRPPVFSPLFLHEQRMEVAVGEKASFVFGTSLRDAWVWMDVFTNGSRTDSRLLQLSDTLMTVEMPYLDSYGESVTLLFNTLKQGRLYSQTVILKRAQPERRLRMKWEVFRDRLRPGQEEEWKLTVTTPDGRPVSAELLALMYDASLDKLYPHRQSWGIFFTRQIDWRSVRLTPSSWFHLSPYYTIPDWKVPGWEFDHFCTAGANRVMELSDLAVNFGSTQTSAMVGTVMRKSASGKAVEQAYVSPAVADVVFEEEVVLEEESVQSVETLQPDADLRTNFAETAFFYPQLRTDSLGRVAIAFTLPQSLTRWNFRGYAHTQDMRTESLEASVVSAKEFMIKPNLPRFFRTGDHVRLAATVSNLTDGLVRGTAILQLFNPETEKVLLTRRQKFEVGGGENVAVAFTFDVDAGCSLLGVRLTADGDTFSDGEQHVLPVLSNQEYVTETLAFDLRGGDRLTLPLDTLFNKDSQTATRRRLTVEVTGNPAWLAVQALPALTQPEGENAVSWAVAYYANTLASYVARSWPRIQQVLEAWKADGKSSQALTSPLAQDEELKALLLAETPWMAEATSETERMQRLVQLFDTNRQRNLNLSALTRLREMQREDGSWSWYKGMPGSRTVTTYIATLLVRLPGLTGNPLDAEAVSMKHRAFGFLHREARAEYDRMRKAEREGTPVVSLPSTAFDYLYLLALDSVEAKEADRSVQNYFLNFLPGMLRTASIGNKAQAAVILQAAGRMTDARAFEASLKEHLVHAPGMGAHFAFNDRYYNLGTMPVATHVTAMEALTRFGGNASLLEEMKRWLLRQKQSTQWNTSVASADAVYALLTGGRNWLADRGDVRLTLGREQLRTTDQTLQPTQGLSYLKQTYEEGHRVFKAKELHVEKVDSGMAWGAVYAQYLSPVADVQAQGTELRVDRQLYVERMSPEGRPALYPLDGGEKLRVGDKVVVRLVLRVDRAMDFVQLKDSRAACLEPLSVLSGYRWTSGFGYYAETRDASTRFFFDRLGKGTYVLEYRCRAALAGSWQSGLAALQCAYAPEMAAHSAAGPMLEVME